MSAASCHSYSAYLNDCMLVVCSNSWAAQLFRTPSEGAKWVETNQVYVHVSQPLWIKPEEARPAQGSSIAEDKHSAEEKR